MRRHNQRLSRQRCCGAVLLRRSKREPRQHLGQQQHGAGDKLCQQVGVQRLVVDRLAVKNQEVGLDLVGNITLEECKGHIYIRDSYSRPEQAAHTARCTATDTSRAAGCTHPRRRLSAPLRPLPRRPPPAAPQCHT